MRQGCVFSPLLVNIYSEHIMQMAWQKIDEGLLVNGERLYNFRYADDTVFFANSMDGLQILITQIAEVYQRYGLKFNTKKT